MKEGATLTMHVYKKNGKKEKNTDCICRFCHHRTYIRQDLRGGNRSQRYDLLTCHQNTIQIFTTRKSRGSGNH